MNRSATLSVTVPVFFAAIAVLLLGSYFVLQRKQYERQQAQLNEKAQANAKVAASSGFDFLVQGRSVVARLIPSSMKIQRGDSLSITFRLDKAAAGNTAGLANEHGGVLTPTLTAGDCIVTPAAAPSKATASMLPAFVWQWSIDDCKTSGSKAVQILLAFRSNDGANGSDPVAYRGLEFVRFDDSVSWDQTLQVLGGITALLTATSALCTLIVGHLRRG